MNRVRTVLGLSLFAMVGVLVNCTTFDDLQADPALVGGGVSSGNGGTCKNPPCVVGPNGEVLGGGKGAECTSGKDCASTICEDTKCTEASSLDGVLNGSETDVDCGGTIPTNAPKCIENKKCKAAEDCLWGACTNGVCDGDKIGSKDGDQTDIDCGGVHSPPCDWEKTCQFDRDCAGGRCGPDKKCLIGPSCAVTHGGTTCGTGEFGEAGKKHETCCKSLLVTGLTDAKQPGKKVYVDKYEITAGRMRAFLESIAKTDPDQVPNVKAWITKNPPARWNPSWTELMPEGLEQGELTYTIAAATANLAYPGPDVHPQNIPDVSPSFKIVPGQYTISTGANFALGAVQYFPEYDAPGNPDPEYGGNHNLNCTTEEGAFGYGTYWQDEATIKGIVGGTGKGKGYTKDQMDEKALNCAPFGLLAAFCAWDGGQLLTDEAYDFLAGGAWPVNVVPAAAGAGPLPPNLANLNTANCLQGLNITSDSSQTCDAVYAFPDPGLGGTFDGSSRIAPPGRVTADVITLGESSWMDLKGNLSEAVLRADGRFHYRGLGIGYASTQAHRTQQTTPRMKSASFGARCMRFRDTEVKK